METSETSGEDGTGDEMPELLTVPEVCDWFAISRATLYRRIREGVITPAPENPMRKRDAPVFHRDDVLRIASKKQKPKAKRGS